MQVEQLRKSLLGLSEAELSSSGAAEPAGTQHRGSWRSSLPAASPTTLGRKRELAKKGVLPHRLCLQEKMKEMQWKNCQLEQLLPRHLCVPPATRGEAPMSQKG